LAIEVSSVFRRKLWYAVMLRISGREFGVEFVRRQSRTGGRSVAERRRVQLRRQVGLLRLRLQLSGRRSPAAK
jgi:hypothetical protein